MHNVTTSLPYSDKPFSAARAQNVPSTNADSRATRDAVSFRIHKRANAWQAEHSESPRAKSRRSAYLTVNGMIRATLSLAGIDQRMADIILAVIACQPADAPAHTPFQAAQAKIGGRSCARGSERKHIERTVGRRLHDLMKIAQPDAGRLFIERASYPYNPETEKAAPAWFIDYLTPAATTAYEQFAAERAGLNRTAEAELFSAKAQWALDQLPKAGPKIKEPKKGGKLMALADYKGQRLAQISESVERTCERITDVYDDYGEAIHFLEEVRQVLLKKQNSLRKAASRENSPRAQLRRAQILAEGDGVAEEGEAVDDYSDNPGFFVLLGIPEDVPDADPTPAMPTVILEEIEADFDADHPDNLSGSPSSNSPEISSLQNHNLHIVKTESVSRWHWLERYHELGFSLVPNHHIEPDGLCSCGKDDCKSQGKHPILKGWANAALKDRGAGYKRLHRNQAENVGVAAGAPSGVICLDFDGAAGRDLHDWLCANGHLPETLTQRTGSGGLQALLKFYPGLKNGVKIAPGLDLRTDGGQFVVPPSRNKNGQYAWLNWGTPIAEMPQLLASFLLTAAGRELEHERDPREFDLERDIAGPWQYCGGTIAAGARNRRLFELASAMRGRCGMGEREILAELEYLRENYCDSGDHPVSDTELKNIASFVTAHYSQGVCNAA